MSVCTLKQNIGGTSRDFTNTKSNRNTTRSDYKCPPVQTYRLNQSKLIFSTQISKGAQSRDDATYKSSLTGLVEIAIILFCYRYRELQCVSIHRQLDIFIQQLLLNKKIKHHITSPLCG